MNIDYSWQGGADINNTIYKLRDKIYTWRHGRSGSHNCLKS